MPIDEILNKLHDDVMDWDELRERRVFNRIQKKIDKPGVWSINRAWVVFGIIAGLCALVLIGLFISPTIHKGSQIHVLGALVDSSPHQKREEAFSTMLIEGVGQVQLISGARVVVWKKTAAEVKFRQTRGRAVYDIEHQSGRQVFVSAHGVEILSAGNVFTVTLESESVHVEVNEGTIRVDDGRRQLELGRGEAIVLAAIPGRAEPEDN